MTRRLRSISTSVLRVLAFATVVMARAPAPAFADGSDVQAEARSRFERGRELLASKRYDEALAELLESRRLFPSRGNTNNAAICLQELGRYDEALGMFAELRAILERQGLAAEVAAVDNSVRTLEAQLGTLHVRVSEADASVSVDGRTLDAGASRTVRLKRGTHVVVAEKPGFTRFERTITLPSGQVTEVGIELASIAPRKSSATTATPAAGTGTSVVAAPPPPPSPSSPTSPTTRFFAEGSAHVGASPSWGGAFAVGGDVRAGAIGFGPVGLFVDLGASTLGGTRTADGSIARVGVGSSPGSVTDDSRLTYGAILGGASYRRGSRWYGEVALAAGFAIGRVHTTRWGRFEDPSGAFVVGDPDDASRRPGVSAGVTAFAFRPELRGGVGVAPGLDVFASVALVGLVPTSRPRWNDALELPAGGQVGSFAATPLVDPFVAVPRLSVGITKTFSSR
ncbi:MAG: PEGA domain-containing protein [Polyangiaceae bacterium]